jgi:molybdenum cofactor cytidylyltransferase
VRPLDRLGAVILAAGLSSRMGGEQKLTKLLHGKPLLRHSLDTVAGLGLADALAVTGHARAGVDAVIAGSGIRSVFNPDYASGLGGSIALGIGNLSPVIEGAFVVLGDMPFVTAEDYRRLADAFAAAGGDRICRPCHAGRPGHPVLFPKRMFAELRSLRGDQGGAPVIGRHQEDVTLVDVGSPRVLADIDTQADFRSGLVE